MIKAIASEAVSDLEKALGRTVKLFLHTIIVYACI